MEKVKREERSYGSGTKYMIQKKPNGRNETTKREKRTKEVKRSQMTKWMKRHFNKANQKKAK